MLNRNTQMRNVQATSHEHFHCHNEMLFVQNYCLPGSDNIWTGKSAPSFRKNLLPHPFRNIYRSFRGRYCLRLPKLGGSSFFLNVSIYMPVKRSSLPKRQWSLMSPLRQPQSPVLSTSDLGLFMYRSYVFIWMLSFITSWSVLFSFLFFSSFLFISSVSSFLLEFCFLRSFLSDVFNGISGKIALTVLTQRFPVHDSPTVRIF